MSNLESLTEKIGSPAGKLVLHVFAALLISSLNGEIPATKKVSIYRLRTLLISCNCYPSRCLTWHLLSAGFKIAPEEPLVSRNRTLFKTDYPQGR
jgi:hypothetical protein